MQDIVLLEGFPWNFIAFVKGGFYIALKAFLPEKKLEGSLEEITKQIHNERFNPKNKYVITGGHFGDLYIRNLGIFYADLLDEFTSKIVIKTITLDLCLLSQAKREPTTFSHLFGKYYTAKNIYTRASDSLYAALFTIKKLLENKNTRQVGRELLQKYKSVLSRLVLQYEKEIMDKSTGLVKKKINLSSARDGIRRQSSFYDNVIAWATFSLAKDLKIINYSKQQINILQQKILSTFWDEKEGIFLDDLSKESLKNHTFCADCFSVLVTGFLDSKKQKGKDKLRKMIDYVEKNNLDKPFPIWYSKENNSKKLYFWVRFFAPSYMGKTIWSHWGMEYIKVLILLGQKEKAQNYLQKYEEKILQYGGYPELYNTEGNIYHTLFYKGVLHNGWVVNYEKVKKMLSVKVTP